MNYRHIFHAGCFADVHKHAILSVLLQAYVDKQKPFVYIDTHAGIGEYDFDREEVRRNPEFQTGVSRFLESEDPDLNTLPYSSLLKPYQTASGLRGYPGSPVIAEKLVSDMASLILNEMHPDDVETLKHEFKGHPATHIHHRDAYEFLPAILPPEPRRAVILIDPPFEAKTEYRDLVGLVKKAMQRFPQGCYQIWYPIKDHQSAELVASLKSFLPQPPLVSELLVNTEGLLGSGVIVINPPWNSEERINAITQKLTSLFNL